MLTPDVARTAQVVVVDESAECRQRKRMSTHHMPSGQIDTSASAFDLAFSAICHSVCVHQSVRSRQMETRRHHEPRSIGAGKWQHGRGRPSSPHSDNLGLGACHRGARTYMAGKFLLTRTVSRCTHHTPLAMRQSARHLLAPPPPCVPTPAAELGCAILCVRREVPA